MMSTGPGPHDLATTRLILNDRQTATAKTVTPEFYAELDNEFASFKGHCLIAQHDFSEAWPTWEMHPEGDEFVYLMFGEIDFVLWVDGVEQIVHVSEPGSYVVVPKGVWHTARPKVPTRMLFVTPGEGTLNAREPEGEAL